MASQFRLVLSEHWHFGKWLFGSVLMDWGYRSIFQITAGILLGASAVGALRAVQMLMGITHIFLQGLENVVPIEAAHRYAELGRLGLVRYLQHVAGFGGFVMVITSLVFLAAPSSWLGFLFGSDFSEYGNLIVWFVAAYLLTFLGIPLGAGLRALCTTKPLFHSYCAGTVVAILCAYPLTWQCGVTGNAAGTALVAGVTQFVLWRSFRNKLAQVSSKITYGRSGKV
jgi:O-antigen/teichoic acid export membrane protein